MQTSSFYRESGKSAYYHHGDHQKWSSHSLYIYIIKKSTVEINKKNHKQWNIPEKLKFIKSLREIIMKI